LLRSVAIIKAVYSVDQIYVVNTVLLYHFQNKYSIDDRCKGLFAYTDAVPTIMQLILNFPQKLSAKELAALAINMSLNAKNAEMMASQRGLQHLVDRVLQTNDVTVGLCYFTCQYTAT
jgi:Kinesin-associated protein (KAP)